MLMKLGKLLGLAAVLLSTLNLQLSTARAQGTAFTYQGVLSQNGAAINGSNDLTFTLYNAVSAGATVGASNVVNDLVMSNGLFTVTLDFGAGAFDGTARWLQIAARPGASTGAYTNLAPRTPVTPTPYAVFANTASNLSGALPAAALSGTYGGTVIFSNAANRFSGIGSNLTALNASQLTGGTVPAAALGNAWKITGNSNTSPGTHFLGTTDNQPLEIKVNNQRGLRLEHGDNALNQSVNVIGGYSSNQVSAGIVGATIAGGGSLNAIGGNSPNRVNADFGTVGGGSLNTAGGGFAATVGGGAQNTASGDYATVPGGVSNTATNYAFAAGNRAKAIHQGAFVWADSQNANFTSTANNQFLIRASGGVGIGTSTPKHKLDVAGNIFLGTAFNGQDFTALGDTLYLGSPRKYLSSTLGAPINGSPDWINLMCHPFSHGILFGTAGPSDADPHSAPNPLMVIQASGNVGIGTTLPSQKLHVSGNMLASGDIFAGGTVGIGTQTPVTTLDVRSATPEITVGTSANTGGALYFGNSGHGVKRGYSQLNDVGLYTTAADVYLSANGTTTSQFVLKNDGNVGIGTSTPARKLTVNAPYYGIEHTDGTVRLGTYLEGGRAFFGTVSPHDLYLMVNDNAGAMVIYTNNNAEFFGEVTTTAVNITSDRNAKEQFKPVNARDVLAKVVGLPISEWQYKTQSDARHIGPMAQDFREAFSLGRDDKHITSVDADGVALAAIQGLNEKLEEKTQEVDALKKSVAALTELVNKLAAQQNGGAR